MARLAIDDDLVAAAARQRFGQCRVRIETVALLFERDHSEVDAEADMTGIGGQFAGQQIDQGCLSDNSDTMARSP
ncbi:MAG: hypothetical protein RL543_1114 [Pseudomonadota bacterium]